jgi:hypothetical protein
MEPTTYLFHDPCSLDETVNHGEGVAYPVQETCHSELSNTLGGTVVHRPYWDWIDQGYIAPHQASPHGYPLYPPEAMFSASTLTHGVLCEPNTDAPQEFQEPADLGACHLGADCAEPASTPFRMAVQGSLLGGYHGNQDSMAPLRADHTYHPSYDFSHTSELRAIPQTHDSISNFMDPGASNLSSLWTTAAPLRDTSEHAESEPHQAGEHSIGGFQGTDQDSGLPSFWILSPHIVEPPPIKYTPNDAEHIHKHMRRGVGGGATCAWTHGGGECGYSSHVDLVKRHIKRVHYRLK